MRSIDHYVTSPLSLNHLRGFDLVVRPWLPYSNSTHAWLIIVSRYINALTLFSVLCCMTLKDGLNLHEPPKFSCFYCPEIQHGTRCASQTPPWGSPSALGSPFAPRRERTVVPSALTNQSILFRSIQFLFSSNGLAAAIERENTRSCADEFGFEKAVTHHPSPVTRPCHGLSGRSSK